MGYLSIYYVQKSRTGIKHQEIDVQMNSPDIWGDFLHNFVLLVEAVA